MTPPPGHEIRVRVGLGAEGPSGAVQPCRVLEWLQDTAAEASLAAGYGAARYQEMGAGWVIRRILLVVEGPIRTRDELSCRTWVADFRRFRSHREYEVWRGGERVARASVEWLFLERDGEGRFRPRRVDDGMLAAFPLNPVRAVVEDEVPPLPEPPPSGAPASARRVRASEIDRHQHVNHVRYLEWLEDQAREQGAEDELASVHLEYALDARLGDELLVRSSRDDSRWAFVVERAGELLLRASMVRRPAWPAEFR